MAVAPNECAFCGHTSATGSAVPECNDTYCPQGTQPFHSRMREDFCIHCLTRHTMTVQCDRDAECGREQPGPVRAAWRLYLAWRRGDV